MSEEKRAKLRAAVSSPSLRLHFCPDGRFCPAGQLGRKTPARQRPIVRRRPRPNRCKRRPPRAKTWPRPSGAKSSLRSNRIGSPFSCPPASAGVFSGVAATSCGPSPGRPSAIGHPRSAPPKPFHRGLDAKQNRFPIAMSSSTATCRYTEVMLTLLWPAASRTSAKVRPPARAWLMNV